MTVSVTFTGVDPVEGQYEDGPFDLASIGSWSEFAAWAAAEPLPPGPLLELTAQGLCANTIGLVEGLRERIDRGPPPPGIGATVNRLLELVGEGAAEEVVVVLDEEPGDPRPTGNAWLDEGPADDPDEDEVDTDVFAGPDPEDQWDEPEVGGASDSAVSNEDLLAMLDPEAPVVNYPGQPRDNLGRFGTGTYAKSVEATKRASGLLGEYKKTGRLTPEQGKELMDSLHTMTVKQLKQLKKDHGIRASGARKSELAHKLAGKLQRQYEGKAAQRAGLETKGTIQKGGRDGEVTTGPGAGQRGGGGGGGGKADGAGGSVGAAPTGPGDAGASGSGGASGVTSGAGPGRVAATKEEATRKLDRMANFFRSKGRHDVADWMDKVKDHVDKVGTDEALRGLGDEVGRGTGEKVHYEGGVGWSDMGSFMESYLNKHGITSIHQPGKELTEGHRSISSLTEQESESKGRGRKGDFKPADPTWGVDKLKEAKHLPGLEKSEDVSKLMGKGVGEITHFTPEVVKKLDEHYGEGKWIVKSYGDEAFAGFGVYFPQRVKQLHEEAKSNIWTSGERLSQYGFSHMRDKEGNLTGIKHSDGKEYPFGSAAYEQTIHGDARHWGDVARSAAKHEKATEMEVREGYEGGRRYMAQPAFEAVGVSDAERAAGRTIAPGEGRVHIVTRDGVATAVPHATWIKGEHLPVVFDDHETRAMAQAAVDAINALPASERQGHTYAPDVIKTKDGYRVVEANPSAKGGGSGYLEDNPFVIDSYVSHITGRDPAHVRFIRDILTKRGKGGQQT